MKRPCRIKPSLVLSGSQVRAERAEVVSHAARINGCQPWLWPHWGYSQLVWTKVRSMKQKNIELCLLYPHDFIGISGNTWRKEPSKVIASSPCYLGQLLHAHPLESRSSFIIKPIRLLPATHSSCWRLSYSFPPLLAANLPAFKQNLLHGIHPGSLSECTILIQLGEEAEDGGASLHSFAARIWENIPLVWGAHCMDER